MNQYYILYFRALIFFFFFFSCDIANIVTIRTRLFLLDEGRKKNQPTTSKQIRKANTVLIKSSQQRGEANAGWNRNKN